MITVAEDRVKEVEYVLEQALQGNHLLFEGIAIDHLLRVPKTAGISFEEAEVHLERLLSERDVTTKRAYLEQMPLKVLTGVVHTYFNIIENTLIQNGNSLH